MIGIFQGRLSKSLDQNLQSFPKDYIIEFFNAKNLGYQFLEYFTEKIINPSNPIWTDTGIKNYKIYSKASKLKNYTFCDNYIINNSIILKKSIIYLKFLISRISKLKIKYLILPLEGASCFKSIDKSKLIQSLKNICIYSKKKKS
jgi:hypothetical protein